MMKIVFTSILMMLVLIAASPPINATQSDNMGSQIFLNDVGHLEAVVDVSTPTVFDILVTMVAPAVEPAPAVIEQNVLALLSAPAANYSISSPPISSIYQREIPRYTAPPLRC